LNRPPTSESLVFIHAGGLHGVAMIFSAGFSARAWRSSGRISARSWAIEKCRSAKSVCPAGTSSYV
jgi:hypothetical protein